MIDKHKTPSCIYIGLTVVFLFSILFLSGAFSTLQYRLHDPLFGGIADEKIVILAVDDKSLQEIGRWPWNRTVFADVIGRLDNAAVIGVDINFAEKSDDDILLGEAIKRNDRVVLPVEYVSFKIENNKPIPKEIIKPIFPDTKVGSINLLTDDDGIVRAVRTDILGEPIFSEAIANNMGKGLQYNVPKKDRLIINALGPEKTIKTISITDVYNNRMDKEEFKNKIILIGATAPDLHDTFYIPTSNGVEVSGVEIHANIVQMIIENSYLKEQSKISVIIITIILSILISFLLSRYNAWIVAGVSLTILIVYIFSVIILFSSGVLIDLIFAPATIILVYATNLVYLFREEKKHKQQIMDAFNKYVSPKVIHELLKHPDKLKLGGERRTITIFFSDIRGFTTISEKLSPEQLVELLNEYLTGMTDIVIDSDGVIDKYMGDAIMAFWGAPLDQPDHSKRAADSAILMMETLKKLQKKWTAEGVPPLDIGIGLNTGPAIIGNMGSTKRFDYTCMGDTINLGSRLEGLNKEYGTHIIISESTKKELHEYITRELDLVAVKGKKEPIRIFELVGKEVDDCMLDAIKHFETGLKKYREQKFDEAIKEFEKAIDANGDVTSKKYIERCNYLKDHLPEKDWDMVWIMKTK